MLSKGRTWISELLVQVSYNDTTVIMYPLHIIVSVKNLGYAHKDYWVIYTFSLVLLIFLYISTETKTFFTVILQEKEKEKKLDYLWTWTTTQLR